MTQWNRTFFWIWLKELNAFWKYDPKNWILFENMTQRIQPLLWTLPFFQHALKNWISVFLKSQRIDFFNMTQRTYFSQRLKEFIVWKKKKDVDAKNWTLIYITQRFELYFKNDAKNQFSWVTTKKKNSKNWTFSFQYDSQSWTAFQCVSKNWTASQFGPKKIGLFQKWLKELNSFDSKNWAFSLFEKKEHDSKNWTFFIYISQSIEPSFSHDSNSWTFFQKFGSKNWTFFLRLASQTWTFFENMTQRIFLIWLTELDHFCGVFKEFNFFQYDSKKINLICKWRKELNPFFLKMTQRIEPWSNLTHRIELFFFRTKPFFFPNMTQRIEFLSKAWLKDLNLLKIWPKELNFSVRWLKETNTFLNTTQRIELLFPIWLKRIEPLFPIWLKRIEPLFPIWLELNLFPIWLELNLFPIWLRRIELFLIHDSKESNSSFYKRDSKILFFEYDSENWTFFFLNIDSKNWTLWFDSQNWTLFHDSKNWTHLNANQIIEPIFQCDSKNWTFFLIYDPKELNASFHNMKPEIEPLFNIYKRVVFFLRFTDLNPSFQHDSKNWTFELKELNAFGKYDSKNLNTLKKITQIVGIFQNMTHRIWTLFKPFFSTWPNPAFQHDS